MILSDGVEGRRERGEDRVTVAGHSSEIREGRRRENGGEG